jgi:hypothetical protein
MKRTRGNEPMWVVKHVCMEVSHKNSLCSYLYLKLGKTPCFSFYLLCFFFYKIGGWIRNRFEGGELAPGRGGGSGESR